MLYSHGYIFHTTIPKALHKALMITKRNSMKEWNLIFFDFSKVLPPTQFQDAYIMEWESPERIDFQVRLYKEIFHNWNKIASSFKKYEWALDYCLKNIYYRSDI